jgi:hypothetical protein
MIGMLDMHTFPGAATAARVNFAFRAGSSMQGNTCLGQYQLPAIQELGLHGERHMAQDE